MCRKNKQTISNIPSANEERDLRRSVIEGIENVLLNWSMPALIITDPAEARENEQKIKGNLQAAKDIMVQMSFPRYNSQVRHYAAKISEELTKFCYVDSRLATPSQQAIVDASEHILKYCRAWSGLSWSTL